MPGSEPRLKCRHLRDGSQLSAGKFSVAVQNLNDLLLCALVVDPKTKVKGKKEKTQAWWHMPLVSTNGRQSWAYICEFKANLAYIMSFRLARTTERERPCLKKTKHNNKR